MHVVPSSTPDELLALGLALLMSTEVLAFDASDTGPAVGSALLAGFALALLRRMPLVAFVVSFAGLAGVLAMAPGLDGESVAFIVIYFHRPLLAGTVDLGLGGLGGSGLSPGINDCPGVPGARAAGQARFQRSRSVLPVR
jgi:hypothetical protein